ncbi:MAG: hypothetical protein PHQ76_02705 [Caldisericia bacterium]|nr:hypothetical protein [Caldisericia bacterium]
MNEKEWIKEVKQQLEVDEICKELNLSIYDGKKIPYSYEILSYKPVDYSGMVPILILCFPGQDMNQL